ncbi:hypothetical protein TrispH2_011856, partial [Trichoplax sp. H2]
MGYKSNSFRISVWLSTLCLFIFVHYVNSDNIDDHQCYSNCQLSILEETQTYNNFKNKIKSPSIRVVFFYLCKENDSQPIRPRHEEQGTFYAWLRNDYGRAIFALPSDYITTSLSLYVIFASSLQVHVMESPEGCYIHANDTCRELIVFKTLVQLIRSNNSKNSSSEKSGSLCRRNFLKNKTSDLGTADYSCCEYKESDSEININKCLKPQTIAWYVPIMRIFTIILSTVLGGNILAKVISSYLDTLEKNTEIDSVSVSVLNQVKLQTVGYFYLRETTGSSKNRWLQIQYSLIYILLFFAGFTGTFISIGLQIFPPFFMILPAVQPLSMLYEIRFWLSIFGGIHCFCTLIIILAHLKQFWLTNSSSYQRLLPLSTSNYKVLTRSNFGHLHLQFITRLKDIINHLTSCHFMKFIKGLLTLLVCLPFFIFGPIELLRIALFMCEVLTLKLKRYFLFTSSELKRFNIIVSPILFLIAFLYSTITIVTFWLTFQVICRIIINVTIFIITHSVYFSIVIVVIIPYVHYITKLIDSYASKGYMLPKRIIKLQQSVESKIDDILTAKQGKLEIYFVVSEDLNNPIITIDLPEMLQDSQIEYYVRRYLQYVVLNHYELVVGMSKVVFQYNLLHDDFVQVTLSPDYNIYFYHGYNDGLNELLACISQHLSDKKVEYYRVKLSQVYYKINNIDDCECIGIPSELFDYIRYYAPEVSLNLWQILYNIIITTCLLVTFIFTVLLDSNKWSFISLNATIASTPIVYIATILSMRYLKVNEPDEETTTEVLMASLI